MGLSLATAMPIAGIMGAYDNPASTDENPPAQSLHPTQPEQPTEPTPTQPTEPEKLCECPEGSEHKYDANKCCDGKDCVCRVYYGEIVGLLNNGENVKVYKENGANITDDQMKTAIENLQIGYGNLNGIGKDNINDKIAEIRVIDDQMWYYKIGNMFGIKFDSTNRFVKNALSSIANGDLQVSMNKQLNDAVKLAKVTVPTPRQLVAFEKSQRTTRTNIRHIMATTRANTGPEEPQAGV